MALDMTQFYEVFFEETAEHLSTLESLLLYLDPRHPDAEQLADIFRAAHSVRGSCGTFGFTEMAARAQEIETAIESVRKGNARLSEPVIGTLLDACGALRKLLAGRRGEGGAQAGAAPHTQARRTRAATNGVMALVEAAAGGKGGGERDSLGEVSEAVRRLGAAIERNARLAEQALEDAESLRESFRALVRTVAALALAPPDKGAAAARPRALPKVRRRPDSPAADEEWPEF